jgi:hypothetical protein
VLLRRGARIAPAGVEVGMVAGSVPHGLGALVAGFDGAHDGTVAVDETRAPWLADHVVLPVSHTAMLLSPPVLAAVLAFLASGRFAPDARAGVA